MLGATVMTASINTASYANGYPDAAIGGLLAAVLFPPLGRFGKFCMVLLALSIITNNCPNIHSVSLSMQVMARWTARVSRWIWTFLGTLAYIAIAIPGYSHFESAFENFMLIIVRLIPLPLSVLNSLIFCWVQAYWLAIYEGIAITDHILFKKGMKGYDTSIDASPKLLPLGAAAFSAFSVGVAGAILGIAHRCSL
jgi:purine-cytosine permease-like protein